MTDKSKTAIVDGQSYRDETGLKDHAGRPISYGSPDAWGGANIRQIGAKNRERQALIDCYTQGQIDTAAFIDHCNADSELLKMWETQRDEK